MVVPYKPKVTDNFLDQEDFDSMVDVLFGKDIKWIWGKIVDFEDACHYCHNFYHEDEPISDFYENINDTFRERLDVNAWVRIKMNAKIRTNEIIEYPIHKDDECKYVSLYYLNTCDGYTFFKDGTKIESIANRLITFPHHLWHGGTSTTNTDRRLVINFNYY